MNDALVFFCILAVFVITNTILFFLSFLQTRKWVGGATGPTPIFELGEVSGRMVFWVLRLVAGPGIGVSPALYALWYSNNKQHRCILVFKHQMKHLSALAQRFVVEHEIAHAKDPALGTYDHFLSEVHADTEATRVLGLTKEQVEAVFVEIRAKCCVNAELYNQVKMRHWRALGMI